MVPPIPLKGPSEVQQEYERLELSLQHVSLPNDLKVYDTNQGSKADLNTAYLMLSKCARYTETALKQLGHLTTMVTLDDKEEYSKLYTIIGAQMKYFQSEYAAKIF